MWTKFLLFIILFLALPLAPLSAENRTQNSSLLGCMEDMGDYLYSRHQNLNVLSEKCSLQVDSEEWGVLDGYKAIIADIKKDYGMFSDTDLMECHQNWRHDWAHIAAMVYEGVEGKEYYHQSYLDIPETLTEFERELVERSLLDQALSNFIVDTYGRKFVQYDGATCRWLYSNLPLARADNIAFLNHWALREKYLRGEILPYVYKPMWFHLQHADLFPEFQKGWLEILKNSYQDHGFPKSLVDELGERVEYNKRFQPDEPETDEYSH